MAQTIHVPDLGFEAGGGVLSNWLKAVGERIAPGEAIAEIESDKVTLEIEATVGGVLLEQLVAPGEPVAVETAIARIGSAPEPAPEPTGPGQMPAAIADQEPNAQPPAASLPYTPRPQPSTAEPALPGDGFLATPIARRMAREHNLDLGQVKGSGPGGRILRQDVTQHLADSDRPPAADTVTATGIPDPSARPTVGPTASRLRQAIAQRMVESKQTIPHFYITVSVRMDRALSLRREMNEALTETERITVNDLVMRAVALALRDYPTLNASFDGTTTVPYSQINVGTAVTVTDGLLIVVTHQADRQTISQLAAGNRAMIRRARSGKVKPEDVTGGTFTISNLGAYETDHFAAIINPPQVAILGVATAREQPVVEDGQIRVATVMQMTLSADHRATDGVEAVRFLHRVRELLETPLKLLI